MTTPPTSTDLAELIAHDHRVIDELFTALATERQDRFPLAHRLLDELATHTAAEQQILYPALRDIVPGGIEMANRAQSEHQTMRRAMETIERTHPGDAEFEEALTALAAEMRATRRWRSRRCCQPSGTRWAINRCSTWGPSTPR